MRAEASARSGFLFIFLVSVVVAACGDDNERSGFATPLPTVTPTAVPRFDYEVPLDPESPWPKFRRNAVQNGRSPVRPVDSGRAPWIFQTGKGIFSTPVIDGAGNVYVGSADRHFYALDRDGNLRWKSLTGEIIDSSALLDDLGRVIFGSGDGTLYALDRESGEPVWTFVADPPEVNGAFINWFEGNVAMGADGTLYAPNDNFCTYAVDRETGMPVWCFKTSDQTWSLPALNPSTGRLFMGSNFYFQDNVLAIDAATGESLWSFDALGSVAASPLVTATGGLAVVGGFDGFLRAFDQESGSEAWSFGARDHIYASPAEAADGTIIQPAADGTVYALRPSDGSVRWAFDTLEPIRSSPAIDGDGNIYVGSGQGRLFVLNPDGTLRWSMLLIDEPRDDLNASPALGNEAIVIAGENGAVFSVPYDYCLREEAASDERCTVGPREDLPDDGVFLLYTTHFGHLLADSPAEIEANQPLTFSLFVREGGDTRVAVVDSASVDVALEPEVPARVDVSGDRKFITIVPLSPYAGPEGGNVAVRTRGDYLVNLDRQGLRFTGGQVGGSFDRSFVFSIRPRATSGGLPLPVPAAPGDPAGIWELYRLAAPLPTILPSYNQIGFDSIHYLIGLVEGDGRKATAWAVGGRLASGENRTEVDPTSIVRFPLNFEYDGGLLTMVNEEGFAVVFNGFPIPFDLFRVATRVDDSGRALVNPAINAKTICGGITFYGPFLQFLGFCNPTTDLLDAVGGAELRPFEGGVQTAPAGVGEVHFESGGGAITARFSGSTLRVDEHNFGILLVDAASGEAVPLDYLTLTTEATAEGTVDRVTLPVPATLASTAVRAYAMIDTYPAHLESFTVGE